MKKINIIWFCMILLMITSVLGSETFFGTFERNKDINLIQTCANCTFVNITSIINPKSTLILGETIMTETGVTYNYTLAAQSIDGKYNVCGIGDLDGINTVWCYTFDITEYGKEKENNFIAIILIYIIMGGTYFFFGNLNQKLTVTDSTKVSTWLAILSYGMIIIKLITLSYFTYAYYIGADIGTLLNAIFLFDLIVLSAIIIVTLFLIILGYANFNKDGGKWDLRKW